MSAKDTALNAWRAPLPDWIDALARECDRTSQNQTAKRIKRSASLVSNVLRRRYTGDMKSVEELVRGALMSETVDCPQIGKMAKDKCQEWRKRADNYQNVNANYIAMFKACNRCPIKKEIDHANAKD